VADAKPIRILIAALGGEGGGVLASWLHAAALASGHFVQGTSVPGVAQRTGATTYYLEIVPGAGARHTLAGARPVLALNAAPGEVDLVVASELLETVRAIAAGFVTPERTTLVASSARVFTVDEKMAMGDGRLDRQRMLDTAQRFARRAAIGDFAALAAEAQSPLSAVLLGAIAASGALPIDRGRDVPRRHPRRGQGGRRQPARLRRRTRAGGGAIGAGRGQTLRLHVR
jgi:indolepyruvate ferredoxin oxidoreductase beta subunit